MANYAEWQEVQRHLNLGGTAEQGPLEQILATAHDVVHAHCGWRFDTTAATYTFPVTDPWDLDLGDLPLASATLTITEDPNDSGVYSSSVSGTAYILLPRNAMVDGMAWPYTRVRRVVGEWATSTLGRYPVQITGTFGWPAVPAPVKTATILIAAWLWANKATPSGQLITEFGPVPMHRIPAAERILHPYRRPERVAGIGVGRS